MNSLEVSENISAGFCAQPPTTKSDSSTVSAQLSSPASSEQPTQWGFAVEAAQKPTASDSYLEREPIAKSHAGDITALCWPSVNDSAGSVSSTKSTLNPEAKEFQIPSGPVGFPVPISPASGGVELHALLQTPMVYCAPMAMPWPPARAGTAGEGVAIQSDKEVVGRWVTGTPSVRVVTGRDGSNGGAGTPVGSTQSSQAQTPQSLIPQILLNFAAECKTYHIVAVFNLESRTTKEELLNIFFPMNAKEAELLPPQFSLRPNRRAGVVFFPSKAFAAVAVEKFNGFVPNGQHQPLGVIYCDPETATSVGTSPLSPNTVGSALQSCIKQQQQPPTRRVAPQPAWAPSPSAKPWRLPPGVELYHTHMEMCRFAQSNLNTNGAAGKHVVAIHGLDPEVIYAVVERNFLQRGAVRFDMWPPKSCSFPVTPMACNSVSALVYYEDEALAMNTVSSFQLKMPEGQSQPIDVVYLNKLFDFHSGGIDLSVSRSRAETPAVGSAGNTRSVLLDQSTLAMFDEIDDFFKRRHSGRDLHLVGVHNLPTAMDKKSLLALFSRYGALDAETYPNVVTLASGPRLSGLIFFDREDTAREAAHKLNGSCSRVQPLPIVARYLPKMCAQGSTGGRVTVEAGMNPSVTPGLHRKAATTGMNDLVLGVGNNELLRGVVEELHGSVVDVNALADKMQRLLTSPDATDETAERLATVLTNTLITFGHHAQALSTPLVNALLSLHEAMRIPRRGGRECGGLEGGEDQDPSMKRNILFISKIARSLVNLFIDNSKPDESRKVAAVLSAYLFQYCYLKKSPYELAVTIIKDREIKLREAKEFERNRSLSSKPSALYDTTKGEEDDHKPCLTLLACLEEFTSLWRKNNKSRAKKDPYRKEYDHCVEGLSPCNSAQGGVTASLSASARPTPRRVVAKVTPGSTNGTCSSSPGLTAASPSSLRFTTRGELMDTSGSHDVSTEYAPSHLMTPVTLPHGDSSVPSVLLRHCGGSGTMGLVQRHVQQQLLQQQQQQRVPQVRPQLSEAATGLDVAKPFSGSRGGGYAPSVYTQAELLERTVYITKLPSTLRRAQFHRLLTHFGMLNKVRLCRDENQVPPKNHSGVTGRSDYEAGAAAPTLWFSFVEFAEPVAAKAIVEYFRNAMFTSSPFSFLLERPKGIPEASYFTQKDIQSLMNVRTSPARNPIHDQLSLDAVLTYSVPPLHVLRVEPCRFGLENGEKTIDSALDVSPFSAFSFPTNAGLAGAGARGRTNTKPPVDAPRARLPEGPCNEQRKDAHESDDDLDINDIMNEGIKFATNSEYMKEMRGMLHDEGKHTSSFESLIMEKCGESGEADDNNGWASQVGPQLSAAPADAHKENEMADFSSTWGNPIFYEPVMTEDDHSAPCSMYL